MAVRCIDPHCDCPKMPCTNKCIVPIPELPQQTWYSIGGAVVSQGSIGAALSLKNLYIVTGEQKHILDLLALASISSDSNGEPCFDARVQESNICYAELERRKGNNV